MFKKILAGVITAVLSLGVVALVAGPASAHHNNISPTVTCATDGTYKVVWAVQNSESNKTEVITVSSNPTMIPPNTTTFGFSETKYFTQFVSEPQNITLALTGFWDGDTTRTNDDVYNNSSATLQKGSFPTGCILVTPKATPQPSVCTGPNTFTSPTYTLVDVKGVKYTVDGADKLPGVYPVTNPSTVTIVATVTDPKYKINGTSTWTFEFKVPPAVCTVEVEPVTPEVKQQVCTGPGQHKLAEYIIPNKPGVLYSVKIGNVEEDKLPGTYSVPEGVTSIQIIARGDTANFFTLKGGTKVYDFTFDLSNKCLVDLKPKSPKVSDGQCDLVNAPGVVPPQTYTLFGLEGVVYSVSTDGGATFADVNVAAGTQQSFPATPGLQLVVRAKSADATKWTVTFTELAKTFGTPGDCKPLLTPLAPEPSHQYCDESDPQQPVLVDGTITLKPVTHIVYFIDGVPAATGVAIPVGNGLHTVTAAVDDPTKYKIDPNATVSWPITIDGDVCLPTEPLVTPAVTSSQIGCFSNGSYTLSNDLKDPAAVIWTVNGSQVSQGKYTVQNTSTIKITAAANGPVYGFQQGVQTSWTIDFKKPTVCDVETLALTGQSPTGLLIAADLLVVAGLALFAMRAVRRGRSQTA